MSSVLNEIIAAMENTYPIYVDSIERWMTSENIEELGALFTLLMEQRYYNRIEPPLSFEDYYSFVKSYYELCLLHNPEGEWSDSRYAAGWSLVNWFEGLWDDAEVTREAVCDLKYWIGELYKNSDEDVRTCLVTATLEHLFERRDIARYFSDWRKDPELSTAYREAMEWQKNNNEN